MLPESALSVAPGVTLPEDSASGPVRRRLPLPAPRLAWLALAGAVPAALSPAHQAWRFAAAYNLLVLLVALLDLWLAVPVGALRLRRHALHILPVAEGGRAGLALHNGGRRPVTLDLVEDLSPPLGGHSPQLHTTVAPGGRAAVGYRITPTRRGDYRIGPCHGRYASPLGLWTLRFTWQATTPVRVFPHLPEVGRTAVLRRRQAEAGRRRLRQRGVGTEFESLRDALPDDDRRLVNWTASARLAHLVVNQYQVERSQYVMLLLDAGRLMLPRYRGVTRFDYALNAALLLGSAAAQRDDRTGLLAFGREVIRFVPPHKGREQVLRLLETTYALEPEMSEPDYAGATAHLQARWKRRSLVVLFTDLVDEGTSAELIAHLAPLVRRHLVVLVAMADPALLALARSLPETPAAAYDKAVALQVLAQREAARAALTARGVLVVDVPPQQLSEAVLARYVEIKERGLL